MARLTNLAHLTTAACVLLSPGLISAFSQASSSSGDVIAIEAVTHVVGNMGNSVRFYRDLLGLEVADPQSELDRIPSVSGAPGAQSRTTILSIPGSTLDLELIEYKGRDSKPARFANFQDPGVACLVFYVRHIDEMMMKLEKAKTRIVTTGGQPILAGTTRAIFGQDPDGFFFALSERHPPPTTSARASSNVIGASLEIVVGDLNQTLRIYHDALKFETSEPTSFIGSKTINEGGNTPGAQLRRSQTDIPGNSLQYMAFMEYKDIEREPLHTGLEEPGTPMVRIGVRQIEAVARALEMAGVERVSRDGDSSIDRTSQKLTVRDPNNIYLEFVQRPAGTK